MKWLMFNNNLLPRSLLKFLLKFLPKFPHKNLHKFLTSLHRRLHLRNQQLRPSPKLPQQLLNSPTTTRIKITRTRRTTTTKAVLLCSDGLIIKKLITVFYKFSRSDSVSLT